MYRWVVVVRLGHDIICGAHVIDSQFTVHSVVGVVTHTHYMRYHIHVYHVDLYYNYC